MSERELPELTELRRLIDAEFGDKVKVEKLAPRLLQKLRVSPLAKGAPSLDIFFESPLLVFGAEGCGIDYFELGPCDDTETALAFLREISQFGFRTERSRWLPWRRRAVRSSDKMTVLPESSSGKIMSSPEFVGGSVRPVPSL